jgi:hypothetical protein
MEVSPSTPTTGAAALTWMLAMRRHRRRQCAGDVQRSRSIACVYLIELAFAGNPYTAQS